MGQRILVVEHDRAQGERFAQQLTNEGYDALFVGDGAEGLQRAAEVQPAVVLIDADAEPSVFDAYALCRQLKGRPDTAAIPIVMLVPRDRMSDILQGLAVGSDHVCVKPIVFDCLLARLRAMVAPSSSQAVHRASDDATRLRQLVEIFNDIIWAPLIECMGWPVLQLMSTQAQLKLAPRASVLQAFTCCDTGLVIEQLMACAREPEMSEQELMQACHTFINELLDMVAKLTGDIMIGTMRHHLVQRTNGL